jgi:hypothetical protein
MINGAHAILYSTNAEADRAFLRDVLRLPSVDVGGGWLIFGLPPAEVAVHPGERNDVHELYLMCDDVEDLVARMRERGVATAPITDLRWGLLTELTLPGGGKLGVYQPKHPRPPAVSTAKKPAKPTAKKPAKSTAKKPAKSTARKPAKSTAKKHAKSTAKKHAKSTAKKPAKSTAKKPAK